MNSLRKTAIMAVPAGVVAGPRPAGRARAGPGSLRADQVPAVPISVAAPEWE